MKQKFCIAGILLLGDVCAQANNYEVISPDGRLAVKVECVDGKQCIINKKGWQISESVTLFMCVGHDTNLTGSNPVAGIYRQAKRMASR